MTPIRATPDGLYQVVYGDPVIYSMSFRFRHLTQLMDLGRLQLQR